MAKFANDNIMNNALYYVTSSVTKIVVCDGQPADYTAATTATGSGGNALGSGSLAPGDFTIADGDTNGRKLTVAEQTGLTVNQSGEANHTALVNDNDSELVLVSTMGTSQEVSAGGTMTVQAFDEEIADPT